MEYLRKAFFKTHFLIVSALCVAGVALGVYLLYEDMRREADSSEGPAHAWIEESKPGTRRKSSKSLVWSEVQGKRPLILKDSVQTGPRSGATIRMKDGSVLELSEKSLVVIDQTQDLTLRYFKGEVILRTSTGDKKVTRDAAGQIKLEAIPVRLLSPSAYARLPVKSEKPHSVTFEWQELSDPAVERTQPASDYALEISKTKNFKKGTVQRFSASKETNFQSQIPLTPGTYFWRISSQQKVLTETRQLTISQVFPLQPLSPHPGQSLVLWGDKAGLAFTWRPRLDELSRTGEHWIEIANSADFSQTLLTAPIRPETGSAFLNQIPSGTLHWRIKSRYSDVEIRSEVRQFTIESAPTLAITLHFPKKETLLEVSPNLRFSWASNATTSIDYLLEVKPAEQADASPVFSVKTKAFSQVWPEPTAGKYLWRIQGLHEGKSVGESPWQELTLFEKAQIPLLAAPSHLIPEEGTKFDRSEIDPAPPTLRWDPVAEAKGYELIISPIGSGRALAGESSGIKRILKEPLFDVSSLPEGKYHWEVRAIDILDRKSPPTPQRSFEVSFGEPLAPPSFLSPEEQ